MFAWLTHLVSGQPLTYLVVFGAAGGDVLFPVIPSETVVITASVVASHGGLMIWLVAAATAAGAFCGDNVSYGLGRWIGEPVARWLFRGDKGRQHLEWGQRQIRQRGPLLVVAGRFIPGGRTATTFAAGTMELEWRRFATADAIGATLWAGYTVALGYLGGAAFAHSLWKPLAASLGVAALITVAIEVARRLHGRRRPDDAERSGAGEPRRGRRAVDASGKPSAQT